MPTELLAPTTSATASTSIEITERYLPVHLFCGPALGSAETADLQISHDGGTTWFDYYDSGSKVQITDTNSGVAVVAGGLYRINKGATSGATGVYAAYEGSA